MTSFNSINSCISEYCTLSIVLTEKEDKKFVFWFRMFKGRQLSGAIDLKTAFNNADIIREGNNFDEILAGLTMQPSEAYDTNFVEDVSLLNFCQLI